MSDVGELERSYCRWLRWYPKSFRGEHEGKILGVLMSTAGEDQRRPAVVECLDLVSSAVRMHVRPMLPRSDRAGLIAVKLMYLGALLELATAIVVVATIGDVRSAILNRNPGYTDAQWQAEVAGSLVPLVAATGVAIAFCLWMAWANGRGHRWARIAFAVFFGVTIYSLVVFFGVTIYSLVHGLAGGSAVYARADLAVSSALWLVQPAALVFAFRRHVPTVAGSPWRADRIGPG